MEHNEQAKKVQLGINIFVAVFLMNFITRVVKPYIGMAYPDQTDLAVQNLITLPSIFGMFSAFLVGPLALKFSKVKLAGASLGCMAFHCLIFFLAGLLGLPFWTLNVASVFAGIAIGAYIPLLNSILSDHMEADKRGNAIAKYNVWINIGGLIITYAAGWLASGNDGANWYMAYLLGLASVIGLAIFLTIMKKIDADTPSIETAASKQEETGAPAKKPGIKDIPPKVFAWIVLMGIVHAFFYVTQNAFNVNASSYIVEEYSLGTSVQAGMATSLVRFALIQATALFPFFKKYLKNWMIPIGYFTMAIGLFLMMNMHSLGSAYACAILCGVSTALVHSEFYSKATLYVPLNLVPVASSIVACLVNVGTGFSAYILAFFSGLLGGGMNNSFKAGIIVSVIIAIVAILMYVVKKPSYAKQ